MGRDRRPNVPRGVFHLTSRVLHRERIFTPPLRSIALEVIAGVVPPSGARLLAVAIMPNHLHLVVQQGRHPLGRMMQSLLRRLVYAVHRHYDSEGPVFWGRYGSSHCLDPEYARNAIVYTHLNAVRARICADPGRYAWSSHALYTGRSAPEPAATDRAMARLRDALDPRPGLSLFVGGRDASLAELRGHYDRYIDWRLAMDRWKDAVAADGVSTPAPPAHPQASVMVRWAPELTPLFHAPAATGRGYGFATGAPDLADIARLTLAVEAPGLACEFIRGRRGGPQHARLRRLIIRRAQDAGHRNVDIARFLDLSESAVSRVGCLPPAR